MMSRRMKILIPVLVAVLLLTVGGTAVVMADEEPLPQTGPLSLLARVAGILGIEQGKLADAFSQARQEMQEELQQERQQWCEENQEECQQWQERWQNRAENWQDMRQRFQLRSEEALDRAVEEGLIDEEQAQEIRDWWENKPEALENVKPPTPRIFGGMRGRHMFGGPRGWHGQIPCPQAD